MGTQTMEAIQKRAAEDEAIAIEARAERQRIGNERAARARAEARRRFQLQIAEVKADLHLFEYLSKQRGLTVPTATALQEFLCPSTVYSATGAPVLRLRQERSLGALKELDAALAEVTS